MDHLDRSSEINKQQSESSEERKSRVRNPCHQRRSVKDWDGKDRNRDGDWALFRKTNRHLKVKNWSWEIYECAIPMVRYNKNLSLIHSYD